MDNEKNILVILIIFCTIGFLFFIKQKTNKTFYKDSSMTEITKMMKQKKKTIVYFYKVNCISCKRLTQKLKNSNLKKYHIIAVNLDKKENVDLNFLSKYDITVTPTFLKIKNGKIVAKTDKIETLNELKLFLEGK